MIKAKPLALAQKLKNIVDICEAADTEIESQKLIQKGALDAGKENDGIEPAVVRKILARRKRLAKDPAETTRQEELGDLYQFMLEGGVPVELPKADDELSRVMALTNTSKPPKIEAIKKALGCSQGKAHKLRTLVAARLAVKSSSSSNENEHEYSDTPHDSDGVVTETQESTDTPAPRGSSLPWAPEAAEVPLSAATPASQNGGVEAGTSFAMSLMGTLQPADEAPAPRSVGAVGPSSARVAPPSDEAALAAMEEAGAKWNAARARV